MSYSPPSRGKPPHPADLQQLKPGPLWEAPKVPDIGKIAISKVKGGPAAGRIIKSGKK